MARRDERVAADAARQAEALASEAGRVLQARAHERAPEVEKPEPKAATPEPVESDNRPVKAFNKVRDAAVEEIEAREEREYREPQPEAVAEVVIPASHDKVPPSPPEPPAAAVELPAEMVRVKVDGEEMDVPKAEIDEAGGVIQYRTNRASENRLKKINESVAEMKRMQAEMAQRAAPALPPPLSLDQLIAQKHDDLRYGTPEQFQAAMREVLNAMAPRAADPMSVATQAETQISFKMAQAQFSRDFADVLSNPDLSDLVRLKVNRALSPYVGPAGPDWGRLSAIDFPQVLSTIGNQVRSVAAPRPSQPQPQAPTAQDAPSPTPDREARKASIVNLPTAAARAALPAEETPMTPAEERLAILADAAKARGKHVG